MGKSKMWEAFDDFVEWLDDEAPWWAWPILSVLMAMCWLAVHFLVVVALVWALELVIDGYWIVLFMPVAAAIWALLHAYGKWKRNWK